MSEYGYRLQVWMVAIWLGFAALFGLFAYFWDESRRDHPSAIGNVALVLMWPLVIAVSAWYVACAVWRAFAPTKRK